MLHETVRNLHTDEQVIHKAYLDYCKEFKLVRDAPDFRVWFKSWLKLESNK